VSFELIDAGNNFVTTATDWIVSHIEDKTTIGLSGGSTPGPVYEALGKHADVDWKDVRFCLIDERYVPPDYNDSNLQMIRSTLWKYGLIPHKNLHYPDTTEPIEKCIAKYIEELYELLPLDIAILGMGPDGHIASLFPPLTDAALGTTSVIHTTTDQFAVHDRISLTLPILKAAKHRLLLLKADKLNAWEEMLKSDEDERRWPLKALIESGELTVITNR